MTLDDYKSLNYEVRLKKDIELDLHVASILELPGCSASGETEAEALSNVLELKDDWLETALEEGFDIPLPYEDREVSGRVTLRMPKSLHASVSKRAELEGISLNLLLVTYISEGFSRNETKLHYQKEASQYVEDFASTFLTANTSRHEAYEEPKFNQMGIKKTIDEQPIRVDFSKNREIGKQQWDEPNQHKEVLNS